MVAIGTSSSSQFFKVAIVHSCIAFIQLVQISLYLRNKLHAPKLLWLLVDVPYMNHQRIETSGQCYKNLRA